MLQSVYRDIRPSPGAIFGIGAVWPVPELRCPGAVWQSLEMYCEAGSPFPSVQAAAQNYHLTNQALRSLALAVVTLAMIEASTSLNRAHTPAAAFEADQVRAAARLWLVSAEAEMFFICAGLEIVDPADLAAWIRADCPGQALREFEYRTGPRRTRRILQDV